MMKQWLLFGLGNPGAQFEGTRHNLGFATLRYWAGLADDLSLDQVHLLWPETGMNESGQVVEAWLKNKQFDLAKMVVLHDDLELPLGEVKLAQGGSAKGHNGVRSVQLALGSQDFKRVRLGIGRPTGDMTVHDFVLGKFNQSELEQVERMYGKAGELLLGVLTEHN